VQRTVMSIGAAHRHIFEPHKMIGTLLL